ncbi:MAG: type IV pili methyl-accepting chemotaxis transducer N-terminal domain-containing protein, partial [Planctomycetota bacterium]
MALSLIALMTIATQVIIQTHLSGQSRDANDINVAGRQRMLSQRLSLLAHRHAAAQDPKLRAEVATSLREALDLWTTSHHQLVVGVDPNANDPVTIRLRGNYDRLSGYV